MQAGIKGELVSFKTDDGLILNGFLVRPKRGSKEALIYLHGMEGSFYRSNAAKVLARKLAARQINFLSIEQRGSYTMLGFKRKTRRKKVIYLAGGAFEKFEDCVYDINGAIRFLNRIGIKKIFLAGHSTGCQKITYYQYKRRDRRVKALVLLAPADDYNIQKKELRRRFNSAVRVARALYKKDRNSEMPREYIKRPYSAGRFLSYSDLRFVESRIFNYDLKRLREFGSVRQPMLAIFGSKEEHALKPVRDYMRILERNTRSSKFDYAIIKNADHGFDGRENAMADAVVDWLKKLDGRQHD